MILRHNRPFISFYLLRSAQCVCIPASQELPQLLPRDGRGSQELLPDNTADRRRLVRDVPGSAHSLHLRPDLGPDKVLQAEIQLPRKTGKPDRIVHEPACRSRRGHGQLDTGKIRRYFPMESDVLREEDSARIVPMGVHRHMGP